MATKLTFKNWLLATRPWSFPASSMPAIVAFLYTWHVYPESHQNWVLGVVAIVGAVIFHAGGNLISDYFDFKHGVDREGVPGTDNLTSGRFAPKQIFVYGSVFILVGIIIGLILVYLTGMILLWIGLVGTVGTIFYYKFKSKALGDLIIFLLYGPTITLGVGYVMHGAIDWNLLYVCVPIAFITVNILHSNNTRDIRSDRYADIKTFAMMIGVKASVIQYILLTVLSYVSIIAMIVFNILPLTALVTLLTIPIAVKNCKAMSQISEDNMTPINELDVKTAQLQLAFSGLLSISLILSLVLC